MIEVDPLIQPSWIPIQSEGAYDFTEQQEPETYERKRHHRMRTKLLAYLLRLSAERGR